MHAPVIIRALIASVGVFTLSSLFALAPSSAAAQQVASPVPSVASRGVSALGVPDITPSSPLGYYIWKDPADGRVHLDTHGPGDEHHFVAHLRTTGTFEAIDATKLEASDSYQLLDGGHGLLLDFDTYQYTDDIAFTVDGANRMRLNLRLDGNPIDTGSVFMGPSGWHPAANPFHIKV